MLGARKLGFIPVFPSSQSTRDEWPHIWSSTGYVRIILSPGSCLAGLWLRWLDVCTGCARRQDGREEGKNMGGRGEGIGIGIDQTSRDICAVASLVLRSRFAE